jgi:hypothetical protein
VNWFLVQQGGEGVGWEKDVNLLHSFPLDRARSGTTVRLANASTPCANISIRVNINQPINILKCFLRINLLIRITFDKPSPKRDSEEGDSGVVFVRCWIRISAIKHDHLTEGFRCIYRSSFARVSVVAGTCLPSYCLETALVYLLISRLLHSNGSTCYNIYRTCLFQEQHFWFLFGGGPWFESRPEHRLP